VKKFNFDLRYEQKNVVTGTWGQFFKLL
jgi:hypothetical protein